MIFHDFLNDRQPQTGAIAAGGHIRFGVLIALLRRETGAVILDLDDDPALVGLGDADDDTTRRRLRGGRRLAAQDRIDRVLQQVGQGLAELAPVAPQHDGSIRELDRKRDVGMGALLQEYGLPAQPGKVLRLHDRCRHPGKGRELVDHALDIADLLDDDVGAGFEDLRVALDLLEIFALQPLRRKLDRGQRILDLVGDAPGHVGPGGLALRGQQLGDVIKGNHKAFGLVVDALRGDPHKEGPRVAGAGDLDLRLDEPQGMATGGLDQLGHLRQGLGQFLSDELLHIYR